MMRPKLSNESHLPSKALKRKFRKLLTTTDPSKTLPLITCVVLFCIKTMASYISLTFANAGVLGVILCTSFILFTFERCSPCFVLNQ